MNYGLISVIILIVSLILLFIFYERKHASVKEISLIATLAGLAGITRVPFAALPNVQPTTFLVIISGYVFGPWFGFMVGAVATLVSNSFLGHGPWTPWQMMAWGLAGFSAGILGKIMKKPSRLCLTIFAFVWGFLFGYIMNLWHWLFFVYPLNLRSFIATYASSFYFDLMHALGNLGFTFFLGKDFINVLTRFKDRISYSEIPVKEIDN
ncbi:ECF transporter S component [Paramaledivibacter caminithermalis]|jgi:energy-coupling factor transport system substrate-specific component|uniref:Energy-coupling factor transport system substrate-specific component n=1 Tax=Paramaledivibacter caminithermalis (strain DSM 15212 / CIP 107654 / DViRD3) TaxID=1121301 RepID=A0A1M6R939_PARC5|nr:ECF transporter S component [Paramaledivibacter caminithermalis]SHK28999.1 energy-coupling factor transport system substrate-specific component [Paramaledivibacter caminithermalis DSM 15212]